MKVRLGDIIGKQISGEWGADDLIGDGVPVLRTANFTKEGYLDYSNIVTRNLSGKNITNKYLRPGDILIEKSGGGPKQPVGRVVYFDSVPNTYVFNNFTSVLRVNDSNSWLPKYIFYALFANYQKGGTLNYQNRTTGLHNLKLDSYISDFQLQNVSLSEQIQKVKILDKLVELQNKCKQQLTKFDELVKSRFMEMFGDPVVNPMKWKQVCFNSICENLDAKRIPIPEVNRKHGLYPYYGASGIVDYVDNFIFDEDLLLISEDGANLLLRSTPIAFSVSGKVWVNNHAHVIRFSEKASQKYVEVYFSLIDISKHITGTAQPKLNQTKLNSILINCPPLPLQQQFAAFVEKVDKSKFIAGARLAGRLYRNLLTKLSLSEADYD